MHLNNANLTINDVNNVFFVLFLLLLSSLIYSSHSATKLTLTLQIINIYK